MPALPPEPDRANLLTVALEDYFQVGAFTRWIQRGQWYRFETRLHQNAQRTLELLDQYQIKATFFVLGWVAEQCPELVRAVAQRGHEIASNGYYHRGIAQLTPEEFRDDLARTRAVLERASGQRIVGYRVPEGWFGPRDLWALSILADEGYAYDASVLPRLRAFAEQPHRRFVHREKCGDKELWEIPPSSVRLGGLSLPIAGGNYFRQLPQWWLRRAVASWMATQQHPFVMYFHVWELDPKQPRIDAAPLLTRIRHYRNLHRMQGILEHYFQRYRFTSIASYLGLDTKLQERPEPSTSRPVPSLAPPSRPAEAERRPAVTIVIPCFNEEMVLPYLANTLRSVLQTLSNRYDLHLLFVDDGSKDGTAAALHALFGSWPQCAIIHHETNQGVLAAIRTGIRNARTELVASLDCDCTYDPHELARMIPLLTEEVDVVTASPYHPAGEVRNVPSWRLLLSRGSSFLYRCILRQKLHTYTSCFRLYRRQAVLALDIEEKGFLGVAELLGKLDLHGSRIVEMPAVLEVRMLGQSKMKTVRTILGHLRLMARLAWLRCRKGAMPLPEPSLPERSVSTPTPATPPTYQESHP